MRARVLLILCVLALLATACGEGSAPLGEDAVALRYSFQPGDSLTYNTDIDLDMTIEGTGDFGLPGGLDVEMQMSMAARTDYSVEEGSDPETVRLLIETDLLDGSGSVSVGGMTQVVPFDEIATQAGSMDVELEINARGEVVGVAVGGRALPPGLLDAIGGIGSSALSGFSPAQLIGPELPEGLIDVGSRWTTEIAEDPFGMGIEVRSEHEVTGTEVVAGRDTFRIVTTTTTEAIEVTFEDLLGMIEDNAGLFAEIAEDEISAAELESALAMLEIMDMDLLYRMDRSVAEMTTWFDAAEGVVVRVEMSGPQSIHIEMSGIPDAGDIAMDMQMDLSAVMQLTE